MRASIRTAIRCAMLLVVVTLAQAAGGKREEPPPTPPSAPPSPEAQAIEHYNAGLAHRDRAAKLENEAAKATKADNREKLAVKIREAYDAARDEFEQAVQHDPALFQAHSDLGYVLRKAGHHEAALEAYDRALAIEPGYGEAVEYRAEACLGLGRLEEVQQAYLQLVGGAPALADRLLLAMKAWVAGRQKAGGAEDESVVAFAAWVAEHGQGGSAEPSSEAPSGEW